MNSSIHNIGTATRNNWIIVTSNGIIAVDTGLAGQEDGFLKRFTKHWRREDLRYVFITHAHNDHAGFLKELLEKTGATVVMCALAQDVLAVGKPSEAHAYKNWLGSILEKAMASKIGSYPPVTDSNRMQIVCDGDCIFEDLGIKAKVVNLPGHTLDSIGLHIVERNIVFCGDAAMNRPVLNANRHTVLIENIKAFQDSWDKLIMLNPALLYPGHGRAFPVGDLARYRHYLQNQH